MGFLKIVPLTTLRTSASILFHCPKPLGEKIVTEQFYSTVIRVQKQGCKEEGGVLKSLFDCHENVL